MAGINPKWLAGLKYHTSEKKEINKDGRKVAHYIPLERALTEADVLSYRIVGEEVVIVTKDGQKYRVPRGPEKAKENEEKK